MTMKIYHKLKDKCSPLRSKNRKRMAKQSLLLIDDCAVGIFLFIFAFINVVSCFVFAASALHYIYLLCQCRVCEWICVFLLRKKKCFVLKKSVHDKNNLILFVNSFFFVSSIHFYSFSFYSFGFL